jgi:hypothetical protein
MPKVDRTDRQKRALANYAVLAALRSYDGIELLLVGDAEMIADGLALIAEAMGIQRPDAKARDMDYLASLRREAGIGEK